MTKKIVLCDMDGILADLTGMILSRVEKEHSVKMKRSDINKWDFKSCFPTGVDPWKYLNEDGFFETLSPLPGAVEGLKRIHKAGAMVVIATSPGRNPNSAAEKRRWLAKHCKFLNHRHVMIGPLKHLLKGDFLIDDSPEQQMNYRKAWPASTILTIKHPFPAYSGVDVEAAGYADTEKAWDTISREVLVRL